ncbi:hypothetical protein HMSSN036_00310 [Paenibacillus macerans]|nr:hypothetical protein HMSSN036_00310 [Paenibacillus macerans]
MAVMSTESAMQEMMRKPAELLYQEELQTLIREDQGKTGRVANVPAVGA